MLNHSEYFNILNSWLSLHSLCGFTEESKYWKFITYFSFFNLLILSPHIYFLYTNNLWTRLKISQAWNLAHTLHGHMYGCKDFTSNNSVNYVYFVKVKYLVQYFTQIFINAHLHIQTFPNLALLDQKYWWKRVQQCDKMWIYDKQHILLKTFPKWDRVSQGQCQCVHDKFHVWARGGSINTVVMKLLSRSAFSKFVDTTILRIISVVPWEVCISVSIESQMILYDCEVSLERFC